MYIYIFQKIVREAEDTADRFLFARRAVRVLNKYNTGNRTGRERSYNRFGRQEDTSSAIDASKKQNPQ